MNYRSFVVLLAECPACHAAPGERCHTMYPYGENHDTTPHAARYTAAGYRQEPS